MTEEQAKYGGNGKASDITKEIEKAKKAGANLLLPSTNIEALSDFHAPVVDSVYLSANKDDGDVYSAGGKKFRITAQGLRKLSVCAGVIWHPYECKRVDDRSDRHYVSFQAIGGIRKADGQPVWWKGEYDLDFEVIEEELRDQYINTVGKWANSNIDWQKKANEDYKQNYIEKCVRRDLLFKRKHKVKLAETGAMNRVIRAILGLKGDYDEKELAKPFVMVRIILRPDFTDKDVRAKLVDASIRAMVGIYGPDTPIETPARDLSSMGEIIDVEPPEEEEQIEPANGPDGDPSPKEVFLSYSSSEKIDVLTKLAKLKGYTLGEEWLPLESKTERNHVRLYDHLQAMVDDDIPF